jgi:hypothetical protein
MADFFDLRTQFEDQFEPNGDGFLYRRYQKNAPVFVTAAERERYLAAFDRFNKYGKWGVAAGTVLIMLAAVVYSVSMNVKIPDAAIYIGIGSIGVIYMFFHFRTWSQPSRELRYRPTVGEGRSKAEIRERIAAKISYGQLALMLAFGIILPATFGRRHGFESFWGVASLAYCAFMIVCVAIIFFRKLRLQSKDNSVK